MKLQIDEAWAREGAELAAKRAAEECALAAALENRERARLSLLKAYQKWESAMQNPPKLTDSHWWQAIGCAIIGWADIIVATVKYPATAPERFVLLALGLVAIGGMLVLATKGEVRK